jgi:pyruvate formate lyase activating enzyme
MQDRVSGRCGARYAKDGRLWTKAWGVGTYPVADPVEKKPLYHFLPGSKVLSFGLLGCNLNCAFCQNWSLSTSHDYGTLQSLTPENCIQIALAQGCSAIAFTYNEPVISSEFCIEVSENAHRFGIKTIAVSNGYIRADAGNDLFDVIDAANIDLKSIDPDFYTKYCEGRLAPVLETLACLAQSERTWVELTNLLIPGLNDSESDIDRLLDWVLTNLGPDVPIHFSAFRPSHHMRTFPITPYDTLRRAKDRALACGAHYVYLGNVPQAQDTTCPNCQNEVIRRLNYTVAKYELLNGKCPECGTLIPGVYSGSTFLS